MPFCTKCGTDIPENVNFCTKCGNAMQESAQVTQEAYQEKYLGLSAWEYYSKCIKNYANFKGRARRKEYWNFFKVNFIITFVLSFLYQFFLAILATKTSSNVSRYFLIILEWLNYIYIIFMISPYLAVLVRRLHDTGKRGIWWLLLLIPSAGPLIAITSRDEWLITLLPLVGVIILLVWCCEDSEPGKNEYGPNPKG